MERSREGEEDIFRNSKKTVRSPAWTGGEGKEEEDLRKMKEMKEDFKRLLEEVKEGFREQGRRMREEMEGLREEYREQVRKWNVEREEVENRLEKLEVEREKNRVGGKREEGVEERLREIERKVERKDREEKKRNIMIRGLEIKEEGRRRGVERLLEEIGAKVEVAEVRRIRKREEKWYG